MIKNSGWVILAALVTFGCNRADADSPEPFQGVVEFEQRQIGFEVGGRLSKVEVRRGQQLEVGQAVAALDDSLERTAREARSSEAEAAAQQADLVGAGARPEEINALASRIEAARANELLLKKNLARERTLYDKGVSPKAAVDELDARLRAAKAERQALQQQLSALRKGARKQELKSAEARADAAKKAVKLESERLARHDLKAPSAGMVLDVHVDPGEVVAPGAPVITLADTAHPYADVFVPQGDLHGISIGTPARVRVDSLSHELKGKVDYISPRTEFTPRFLFSERERPNLVIRVRIAIEDPKRELHAGIPAFVNIDRSDAQ